MIARSQSTRSPAASSAEAVPDAKTQDIRPSGDGRASSATARSGRPGAIEKRVRAAQAEFARHGHRGSGLLQAGARVPSRSVPGS